MLAVVIGKIHVIKQHKSKTAFVCQAGLYRYKQMPFGVAIASATNHKALDVTQSSTNKNYAWDT